jgi:hypothetical protein
MIYILGLDGLDINLVNIFNLTNLKQNEYGGIKVPINPKKREPHSVQVWESFLTGKIAKPREFNPSLKYKIFHPLLVKLKKILPYKCGISQYLKDTNFPKIKEKTFLDNENSITINAPFYNFNNEDFKITQQFASNLIDRKTTLNLLINTLDEQINYINIENKNVKNNYDIIFSYLHYPDNIQHIFFKEINIIKNIYGKLSELSHNISKYVRPDLYLIISDHGFNFKTLKHSKKGFYSSNRKLNPKPNNITDFYQLICSYK